MANILIRFVIGGVVVSVFAILGDVLKPKSFAGLFGAAPSVALATLGLTVANEGKLYAATEARSMTAGALAFLVYASFVSWALMRYEVKTLLLTICVMPLWMSVAFAIWRVWLR